MLIVRSCAAWNATTANVLPHRGNPSMQISVCLVTSSPLRRTSSRDRMGDRPATDLTSQAARRAGISRAPILTPLLQEVLGGFVNVMAPTLSEGPHRRRCWAERKARERLLVQDRHR